MDKAPDDAGSVTGLTAELTGVEGARRWRIEGSALSEPMVRHLRDGERIVIGSGSRVDMRISDRAVSSTHCSIAIEDGHPVLRDLQSKNGVFLGGAKVDAARLC